jgi:hypothetical protein
VIDHHPAEYFPVDGWQERAVRCCGLPPALSSLLDSLLSSRLERKDAGVNQPEEMQPDRRRLGL